MRFIMAKHRQGRINDAGTGDFALFAGNDDLAKFAAPRFGERNCHGVRSKCRRNRG